ncbi:GrpB family protein [Azohydromonas sp.]|uniref:GrpB family protein n=1 Tax=Azohydromonas sp. TaxID=1872666 RepID=UPI002D1F9A37|nr:GrpB family protein [Azohydromonas sp.]
MITLVPHDPAWAAVFAAEAAALRGAFGALALRVEHVGSTAVPGLEAKPVIDIQVSVRSLAPRDALDAALARLGYRHTSLGDFDRVYPFFHKPAAWPSTHHVHLCEAGGEQEWRHLAFRDALRDSPQAAAEYASLKRRLAALHGGHTPASREAYSLAKSGFVAAVLARVAPTLFDTPRFSARGRVDAAPNAACDRCACGGRACDPAAPP